MYMRGAGLLTVWRPELDIMLFPSVISLPYSPETGSLKESAAYHFSARLPNNKP